MRIIIAAFFLLLFITGCKSKTASKDKTEETKQSDTATVASGPKDKNAALTQQTSTVMSLLEAKDYSTLANHIHPRYGVRFSPYGYIDTSKDVVLTREAFAAEATRKDQKVIKWGEFDGTGDPIMMTFNEYMNRFVYPKDFAKPESFKINEITNPGNAQNNILAVYPGADFTDSHFSGFEKKYEGMDWRSLRLIYRFENGNYYLVGVVHDQWTI